ncbi:MAG: fimbria/pilus outer membrane usher protein [Pseudomonas sp.]
MLQLDRRRLLPSRFAPLLVLGSGSLLLASIRLAIADESTLQFNSGFIRQSQDQPAEAGALALQQLAADKPLVSGRYQIDLLVNLTPSGTRDLDIHDGPDGQGLQACVTTGLLRELGLREQALDQPLPADGRCLDLSALVPQAKVEFDPEQLRLNLSIPQIALRRDVAGSVAPERWEDGINAAFINYQASAQHSSRRDGSTRSSQDLYLNSGVNLGAWRLRSNQALRENEAGERSWTRSDTYAQRDIPGLHANLTLGETFTRGEMFRSLPFQGAQVASDQDMLPDVMQNYAPILRGVAQTRAKLEVLHNGYPIYSTYVAPGPYEIDDLSVGGGHGELEIVLTEADGQVRRFTQAYSTLNNLLREGTWRYSAAVGRYNGAEHLDDPLFWQATLARGGAWDSTLYGGLLSADYYRAGLLGLGRDLGTLGAVSFDVTQAYTDLGNSLGEVQGTSFSARYGKSFQTRTNLRFAGYRYSTEGYRDFDEAVLQRNSASSYRGNRRSRLEASMYQNFGQSSSLSLSLSQDDYWKSNYQRRQYQFQFNTRVGDLNINLFASQALNEQSDNSRQLGIGVSLPLDFSHARSVSFDLQQSDDRYSQRASLDGSAYDNRLNYRTSVSNDEQQRKSAAVALAYQTGQVSYGAGYTEGSDYRSLSVNASGALLIHDEGIEFGNYMGETSALVQVPDIAGVGIESAPTATTNDRGYALVPHLRPYRVNQLVLRTDDLGPQVIIDNGTQQVVPRRGAILKATFEARKVVRMVLTLHQADGRALPFGAQVSNEQGQPLAVVGQGGQALVASEQGAQTLLVQWHDKTAQTCRLAIDPEQMTEEQGYHLQTLQCHPQ